MNTTSKLAFVILLFLQCGLSAQSEWESHITLGLVNDVLVKDNKTYIAHNGGLLVIDNLTKEEKRFHPGNSKIEELSVKNLTLLDNGQILVNTDVLYSFDGEEFEIILTSLDNIRHVVSIGDVLWIGVGLNESRWAEEEIYSLENNILINHTDDFPSGVRSIAKDNENNLWVIYNNESDASFLATYNGRKKKDIHRLSHSNYLNVVHYIDSKNQHWIYDEFGVNYLQVINDDSNEIFTGFGNRTIEGFYETSDGVVQLYNDNSFGTFNNGLELESIVSLYPDLPSDARVIHGQGLDTLWVQSGSDTHNYSLQTVVQDEVVDYWNHMSYLGSPIEDLAQDCNGNLLSLVSHHINILSSDEWSITPLVSRNPSCFFKSFIDNPFRCEPWIGTESVDCPSLWSLENDLLFEIPILPDGTTPRFFNGESSLLCASSARSGDIIMIDSIGRSRPIDSPTFSYCFGSGISIGPNSAAVVIKENSFPKDDFLIYTLDNEGNWFDGVDVGNFIALPNWIYSDTIGQMWTSSSNSLIQYSNGSATIHKFDNEEVSNEFLDMTKDKYGNYWLAIENSGIARWDQESICLFNTRNSGLLSNDCYDLEILNGDELWVNHRYGLTKMKIDSLSNLPKVNNTEFLYSLYPNPSSGQITLANPNIQERVIDIFNWRGALVSSEISRDPEWSTSLEAGVYWVKIKEGESEALEKVVVLE